MEFADKLKTMTVNPTPNIFVSYWTFRIMMGLGFLAMIVGAYMLWVTRKGATPKAGKLWTAMMFGLPLLPLFANSFGWTFTEMGRQPWIVAGVLPTALAVSPTVSVGEVWFTMIVYTLVYGALAVIELGLLFRYIKKGLPDVAPVAQIVDEDAPLSFAY
jgi:cytochrome d ubiquinol oxidase subunit I